MAPSLVRTGGTSAERARGSRQSGIVLVAAMVVVMWVSETLDALPGVDLDQFGIQPREPDGLVGVVASPFLHSGFAHLVANTVPFLLMGLLIALGGALRVAQVTVIVALVGGLGTWLLAPGSSIHIGASGIVFGYAGYLVSRAYFNRRMLEVALAVVVLLVWGGGLLIGLVPQAGVSWSGHAFGLVGGVIAARLLAPPRVRETVGGV